MKEIWHSRSCRMSVDYLINILENRSLAAQTLPRILCRVVTSNISHLFILLQVRQTTAESKYQKFSLSNQISDLNVHTNSPTHTPKESVPSCSHLHLPFYLHPLASTAIDSPDHFSCSHISFLLRNNFK